MKKLPHPQQLNSIPYRGKLLREKTFTNFMVLEPPMKDFSTKFGHAISNCVRFQHCVKVFSTKWRSVKVFSLESFPLYGIAHMVQSHQYRVYTVYLFSICTKRSSIVVDVLSPHALITDDKSIVQQSQQINLCHIAMCVHSHRPQTLPAHPVLSAGCIACTIHLNAVYFSSGLAVAVYQAIYRCLDAGASIRLLDCSYFSIICI